MEVSGSERGGPASAAGVRCKPELISALKPRPKFLDGLLIAEGYLSCDRAKSAKRRLHNASVAPLSRMFHEKSAFVSEVLNSLTAIIFTTELAH
jgi:hypothetical protein